MNDRVGVVLMAYGTPRHPDELPAYYTDIRRGRPPTAELLAELRGRYDAIGGLSPLAAITDAQHRRLQATLDERAPGRFDVRLGLKHTPPFIEDAVRGLALDGVTRAVGLVLAPHWSAPSIGTYQERAASAGAGLGLRVVPIDSWHLEPAYLDFLAAGVTERLASLPEGSKVLFTAHSIPQRYVDSGDPYPQQLRQTAEAVAGRVGLQPWSGWAVAWQSAGRTPDPWIGPDVLEVLRDLGATGRGTGVLVCPCGFVADHLEVLYDLDVEARAVAEGAGLAFARTPSMNDDPTVLGALADRVAAAAG
ncbi:MAG: ferrochelatase [Acidimicrobiales bacterium]|nr:ferrochelatase [Acidimicrobiales bacterium]